MTTCSTLYAIVVAFFVATNLPVGIKTDAPDIALISPPPLETSTSNIESLPIKTFHNRIVTLLSPDIFSHPDPLALILARVTRNAYKKGQEVSAYIDSDITTIKQHVDYFLASRKFPRIYTPYAKLLSSLLNCLFKLHRVSKNIAEIQEKYSAESNYPPPPTGILTLELHDLFSTDVFSDPNIPLVLVKKILKIPDDRMPEVTTDLVQLLEKHNYVQQVYYNYMRSLRIFFSSKDDIRRLKFQDLDIQQRLQRNKNQNV